MSEKHYRVGVLIHRWDCAEAEYKLVRSSYPHNSLTKMQADRLHDAVCELEPPCCKFTPAPKPVLGPFSALVKDFAKLIAEEAEKPQPEPDAGETFKAEKQGDMWLFTDSRLPHYRGKYWPELKKVVLLAASRRNQYHEVHTDVEIECLVTAEDYAKDHFDRLSGLK